MSDAPHKPRLRPHVRSNLHFLATCIEVERAEEAQLPGWIDPEVLSELYGSGPVFRRQAQRHAFHVESCRGLASLYAEARGVDFDALPEPAQAAMTELMCGQIGLIEGAVRSEPRKRPAVVVANGERDFAVNKALAALYVGPGQGNRSQTARLAQAKTPSSEVKGHAVANWHVRDRVTAYAKKALSFGPDPRRNLAYVAILAIEAIEVFERATVAWRRVKADESTKDPVVKLDNALLSGNLAEWLLEGATSQRDLPISRFDRPIMRLQTMALASLIKHLEGLSERAPRTVSATKKGR